MSSQSKRRAAELAAYNLTVSALIKPLDRSLVRLLYKTSRTAESGYLKSGQLGALRALEDFETSLKKRLFRHYRRTYDIFGSLLFESLKSDNLLLEAKDAGNVLDEFEIRTRFYLSSIGGRQITKITETTRSSIMKAIQKGNAEGDGVAAIAARIREKVGGKIGKARANVIARTETHSAANSATFDAAGSSGIDGVFEWMSIHGPRTRNSHARADGQRRKKGNKFKVGASQLRFPGDPLGAAHEIIYCRCGLGFRPGNLAEQDGIPEGSNIPNRPSKDILEAPQLDKKFGLKIYDEPGIANHKFSGARYNASDFQEMVGVVETELDRLKAAGIGNIAKNIYLSTHRPRGNANGVAYIQFERNLGYFKTPRIMQLKHQPPSIAVQLQNAVWQNDFGQPWSARSKNPGAPYIAHTVRHEIGHLLTTPVVISEFSEVGAAMYRKELMPNKRLRIPSDMKANFAIVWFRPNLSHYAGSKIEEAIAEAFARFTAANYVKGELPEQIEKVLEIMAKGKLPDRNANGDIVGRTPGTETDFSDFAEKENDLADIETPPPPGYMWVDYSAVHDDKGNLIRRGLHEEDSNLQLVKVEDYDAYLLSLLEE